jgi:alpha-galactosidase
MAKITIIGAGSIVFAKNLIGDVLSIPELSDSVISLMDIDEKRLNITASLANKIVEKLRCKAKIISTTDRREAIKDSDYVITTIQVGGLKAYELDLQIPMKYGVNQNVGDTLGPGGVFRALRTIPVIVDICHEMEQLCPNALLMNYVNPMCMITWAVSKASKIKCVGLCHSVQGTAENIADYIGAPLQEITFKVAGINHMAWFLEYKWNGKDAYPLIREAMKNPAIYNKDIIKFEVMKYFGYFITESSYHLSEYLPYFRKNAKMLKDIENMDSWLKDWNGNCFSYVSDRQDEFYEKIDRVINGLEPVDIKKSKEYGSHIIYSIETNTPYEINGNVINHGLIKNLPENCCVEVPCLVDANGITPCCMDDLPSQLAGLNRSNINTQELAVEAALTGNRNKALQAIILDPLTASSIDLETANKMVDEMFDREKEYLPQF